MLLTAKNRTDSVESEPAHRCGETAESPLNSGKGRAAAAKKTRGIKQTVMGALFLAILGAGFFFPLIGYFIPLCMVAGIGMALFRGRKWCNWYCPRGSWADSFMSKISPGRPIPGIFRGFPLRVGALAFLMAMLTFQIVRLWPDFVRIGGFFMILLTVTTAIGLILAMVFHPRAWCYLCPIGSISHWAGRNRYPLVLAKEECVECKACAKACPMQLTPYETDAGGFPGRGDCLKCGLCVASCPKDALRFRRG
jgi:ferredoxin-type protein NapH